MSPMRKEAAGVLLTIAAVGALVFVEGEIATRVFRLESDVLIELDSCTGFKPIPHASGYSNVAGGPRLMEMNSAGFRDVEHTIEKERDVIRILVLGDSVTEAAQVPLEDTFWRQLERLLDERGKSAEVISLGVASFGTNQELLAYGCYGRQYRPDIVLLVFFDGNDIVDNYFRKEPFVPRFTLSEGELTLDETYKKEIADREALRRTLFPGALYWLKDNSSFARMLYNKMQLALSGQTLEATPVAEMNPIGLKTYTPEWEEGWLMTDALIARLAGQVRESGGRLILVRAPSIEQMERADEQDAQYDFSKPAARLQAIAHAHRLSFIDLYPSLAEAQEKAPVNFITDVHWNTHGHRVVAETLLQHINLR